MIATAEIVSVALTLAVTWLALEYGLKYRITEKILVHLEIIPRWLGSAYGVLNYKFSHVWSLSRKQKKEKDEEILETMERRRSVQSRVSVVSGASRTSRIGRMSRASATKKRSPEADQGKEDV